MALFGAPIVEEIAFRGLLYGALAKAHINEHLVVVITAIVFALFHFEPKRFVILFAIGMILGEVRRRTGSTSAAMVTHVVNNAPAAIFILVTALRN
jgi:membrane protease YdiL (CAAX protease family)